MGLAAGEAVEDLVGARSAGVRCNVEGIREVGEHGDANIQHVADAAIVEFCGHQLLEYHRQLGAGQILGIEASGTSPDEIFNRLARG